MHLSDGVYTHVIQLADIRKLVEAAGFGLFAVATSVASPCRVHGRV